LLAEQDRPDDFAKELRVRRTLAAMGSVVFFVAAPGTVAGLVPWWITRWQVREPSPYWAPLRVLGAPPPASSFLCTRSRDS
jgi:hypothetical protein